MNANGLVVAWTEFIKAQAEGITDIRSMERALAAANKYIVADERELLRDFANAVEALAFKMPPPNEWTPQFVQLAQSALTYPSRLSSVVEATRR